MPYALPDEMELLQQLITEDAESFARSMSFTRGVSFYLLFV